MRGIKLKTMLLIILICILAGMILALSNPDVLSAAVDMLQPAGLAAAATDAPPTAAPEVTGLSGKQATPPRSSGSGEPLPTAKAGSQYYSDVESVYVSPRKDHWTYQSPALYVDIQKKTAKSPARLVYYVAEVRTTDPSLLCSRYAGDDTSGKVKLLPEQIAVKNKAIFAVASDCCTPIKQKGIIIRAGVLQADKMKADTLALFPDGAVTVYTPRQITPSALISKGVKNTYSCGPTLIKNGVITATLAKHKLNPRSARTGMGMIEPGHYVFIVVDGCDNNYSVGATLTEFAAMFKKLGCKLAYNLDGDQAASMCFMGQQLNGMPGKKGDAQKKVSDLLAVGMSDLVSLK